MVSDDIVGAHDAVLVFRYTLSGPNVDRFAVVHNNDGATANLVFAKGGLKGPFSVTIISTNPYGNSTQAVS